MTTETKGPGVGGGPDVTFSCYRSIIGCLIQIQLAQIKQDRTAKPGPAAFEIGSSGGFEMGPVVALRWVQWWCGHLTHVVAS